MKILQDIVKCLKNIPEKFQVENHNNHGIVLEKLSLDKNKLNVVKYGQGLKLHKYFLNICLN